MILSWDDNRYELGLFRVTTQQVLYDGHSRYGRIMADPYWGASMSRRWRLYERDLLTLFVGFGFAAKTESDQLSSTRVDFAEQLGVRFRFPGDRVIAELTMRHWSNAGIRLPNHGQDFATLTFKLNTGHVGIDKAERISVDGLSRQGFVMSWSEDHDTLTNNCCAAPTDSALQGIGLAALDPRGQYFASNPMLERAPEPSPATLLGETPQGL